MSSDNLIIGGGIYGAGTAWELARRGEEVTLLEAETIASGASGGLGKRGIRANGRDPRELPLMEIAYELWPKLADRIDAETGYERTGHLLLYEKEAGGIQGGYTSSDGRQRVQEEFGVPTDRLTAEEVRDLEPHVSDDVIGALYCPNDGVADHTATTRGLAQAADRLGATIHENTPVRGIQRDGDEVTAVLTNDDRFNVDGTVLFLSNTHVSDIVESELDIELPMWEMFPQVIATESIDPVPVKHLIGHDHRRLALKEIADDRVMISGGWRGKWDEASQRGVTVPERVDGNVADARAVFPDLETVEVDESDASRRESVTVDHVPIIDTLPGADNLIIGTGWSGHGFAISLAVNRLLAEWAVNGSRPDLLTPFTVDRFTTTGSVANSSLHK